MPSSNGKSIDRGKKLYDAVKEGNLERVKKLISYRVDPNWVCNSDGRDINCRRVALHVAATRGAYEILKVLVSSPSVNVHVRCSQGRTALHYLSMSRTSTETIKQCLRLLLDAGIDPNTLDFAQNSATYYALIHGKKEIAKILMKESRQSNENDKNWDDIHYAVLEENYEEVTRLINAGSSWNRSSVEGVQPIHLAATNEETDIISYVAAGYGASVDSTDSSKRRPLHFAAICGSARTANFILKLGGTIDPVDDSFYTPLHRAALNGNLEVMNLLLENGANVNASHENDVSILVLALAKNNPPEVALKLIEKGADIHKEDNKGVSPLLSSCVNGQSEVCEALLEKGANPKFSTIKAYTLLHIAASKGCFNVSKLLVEKAKLDVNAMNEMKQTPLHLMSQTPLYFVRQNLQYGELLEYLIQKGANIDAQDTNGSTPLMNACLFGNTLAVDIFLSHNASFSLHAIEGSTALHFACQSGDATIVEHLVKLDANGNAMDSRRRTPLHICMILFHLECAKKLLGDPKLDIEKKDAQGKTPLISAVISGKVESVHLLLDVNANPNAKDIYGYTPLHHAAILGHTDITKLLLRKGADVFAKNIKDETPEMLAMYMRNEDTLIELYEHHTPPPKRDLLGDSKKKRKSTISKPDRPAPSPSNSPNPSRRNLLESKSSQTKLSGLRENHTEEKKEESPKPAKEPASILTNLPKEIRAVVPKAWKPPPPKEAKPPPPSYAKPKTYVNRPREYVRTQDIVFDPGNKFNTIAGSDRTYQKPVVSDTSIFSNLPLPPSPFRSPDVSPPVSRMGSFRNTDDKILARALFDFEPFETSELELKKDDILVVLQRNEDGWWGGSLKGKVGYFPATYVQVIPSNMMMKA